MDVLNTIASVVFNWNNMPGWTLLLLEANFIL